MNVQNNRTRPRRNWSRDGAAAVECAVVTPLLALLLLGAIDVGQYANVYQEVSDASRKGARVAARYNTQTTSEVVGAVMSYLEEAFPGESSSTLASATDVTVTDATGSSIANGNLQSIPSGSQIQVRVKVSFDPLRWIRSVKSLDGVELVTTTKMRRE